MILKINNKNTNMITLVRVASLEYNNQKQELKIWDVSDNPAYIIPESAYSFETIVRDLYSRERAEIDGEIDWCNSDKEE